MNDDRVNRDAHIRFQSLIEIDNINPYVLVSSEHAVRLKNDWRKPLPVRFRMNGKPTTPWPTNLMPIGDGSFYLYLHGKARAASGTKVGDVVSLEVQFDDEYRSGPVHPMPLWFNEALDRNPTANRTWDALIPSLQKEILRYFARLKSSEAQARNVEQAIRVLSGEKGRFMARSWNEERALIDAGDRVRAQPRLAGAAALLIKR